MRRDGRADARAGRLLPPNAENTPVVRDEFTRWSNEERQERVVHDLESENRILRHRVEALEAVARTVMRLTQPYAMKANGQ